ncbi:ribosomal protein subunit Yml6 [Schizosaccharomyces japonicus yFS275]|uniref:Large ribosomal subunit protein uL4m n=1 Tax=Schizosaccharomyces japonicus (strain yFS275 / FY16936) TaxID=402676 RepID=B6K4T6_SCHJY|nr:ribosomal protein subunit Yml6 [Schizosaccharomyces japonicus yFS275]EEB08493.1 ribosomal protein subunit Yml6 [Schizosaccharomyces japonicus yFS275]
MTLNLIRYAFPSLEPMGFLHIPRPFLTEPLRRDILQKAVVFEANRDRAGTANTKSRSEINCSGKKLRPQKGTGRARLGDASSPMLRGGAVAHGPKPRDFTTKMPTKIFSKAMRVALSERFRQNELLVLDSPLHTEQLTSKLLNAFVKLHDLGAPYGRTLFILDDLSYSTSAATNKRFIEATTSLGRHCEFLPASQLQIRHALKFGKLAIEHKAFSTLYQLYHDPCYLLPHLATASVSTSDISGCS